MMALTEIDKKINLHSPTIPIHFISKFRVPVFQYLSYRIQADSLQRNSEIGLGTVRYISVKVPFCVISFKVIEVNIFILFDNNFFLG